MYLGRDIGEPNFKQEVKAKDPEWIGYVKSCSCVTCGAAAPSEAHHCRDMPDYDERDIYTRLPAAARKSGDRDTLPLCPPCHWLFHNRRSEFHDRYGRDYRMLKQVREIVNRMEEDDLLKDWL